MITCERLIPGHYYHVYNRGNNKEILFYEPRNYEYFLDQWNYYISPIVNTYVYSLLKNHFHFFIQVKPFTELREFLTTKKKKNRPSHQILSQQFSNCFNSYAKTINKYYDRTGSLFQERFRRKLIASNDYFTELMYYIHSNPQKHKITKDFFNYPYSSFNVIASDKDSFIKKESVINCFGSHENFINYHKSYRDTFISEGLFLEHLRDDAAYKMEKEKRKTRKTILSSVDF